MTQELGYIIRTNDARLLVSRNKQPPIVQRSGKNREVLTIYTDKGSTTFNFAPNSRIYTFLDRSKQNKAPLVLYNPKYIQLLNLPQSSQRNKTIQAKSFPLSLLERKVSLEPLCLDQLQCFDQDIQISGRLRGYKKELRDLLEQRELSFINYIKGPNLDRIRVHNTDGDYKIEVAYKAGSLRGKVIVTTMPEIEVSPFMYDIPKLREEYFSIKD